MADASSLLVFFSGSSFNEQTLNNSLPWQCFWTSVLKWSLVHQIIQWRARVYSWQAPQKASSVTSRLIECFKLFATVNTLQEAEIWKREY